MIPHPDDQVPVFLLTGFLGSGKTTLLNEELAAGGADETLVIVNEFGEVGLDQALIEASVDNVHLLADGCLCCASLGDLRATLAHIGSRRRLGLLPPFSRVVVETSGIADPAPLVETLCAPATREAGFRLAAIVAVVDVLHGGAHIAGHAEARRQVAMADVVILSKTDLCADAEAEALRARIGGLNPGAGIVAKSPGRGPLLRDISRDAADHTAPPVGRHGHGHAHGFATRTARRDEPVRWDALADWLGAVVSLRGADILRLKGLVRCREHARPVLVQGVHHWLDAPRTLSRWPDDAAATRLVFITAADGPSDFQISMDHAVG